ncbi:MAG: DedA family protein, partial [Desulfobacterales bacterium]
MDLLAQYGYIGLFIASFLAATILPFSSEIVLVFLLLNNHDPFISITVATAGNVLGSVSNYAIGFWGSFLIMEKLL